MVEPSCYLVIPIWEGWFKDKILSKWEDSLEASRASPDAKSNQKYVWCLERQQNNIPSAQRSKR